MANHYLTLGILGFILFIILLNGIKLIKEYERAVIFRLGRYNGAKGPGLFFVIPYIDRVQIIDLRTQVVDIPSQETITRDNVPALVNAAVFYAVEDPGKAVIRVENYHYAVSQIAQTTLRSVIGSVDLDDLLSNRDKINAEILEILDDASDAWGIDVSVVEIKDLELPREMKRAMAKQAESERERRSRIILADGEYQASMKLAAAAREISDSGGLTLRLFQTLQDISTENSSTVIIPFPAELSGALGGLAKAINPSAKVLDVGSATDEENTETKPLKEILNQDAEDILPDEESMK